MKILKKLLQKRAEPNKFSEFITSYSSKDRVRIIREAARGANSDQRSLVEKYDRYEKKGSVGYSCN